MTTDPRDTLLIVGGHAVAQVDADAVRLAARLAEEAVVGLRSATMRCASARRELDRELWTPPGLGRADDVTRPAELRRVRDLADDAARSLAARADACERLGARLLLAAGLYVRAESTAARVVGAIVTGGSGMVGHVLTRTVAEPVRGLPWRIAARGVLSVLALAGADDGSPGRAAPPDDVDPDGGGLGGHLLRAGAPWADEVVLGAGWGVATGAPWASRGDVSVTGGARALSDVVADALPHIDVEVTRLAAADVDGGLPPWSSTPAGSVAEALARTDDLYPRGSRDPERGGSRPPPGTIGVTEVTRGDGTTAWTVYVPGTQEVLSTTNPFDGATDLDLMAHRTAEVSHAVQVALADAGAAPDEPVVLVGHSLGGISAMALAASPELRRHHRLGGVVTAGAPTATFTSPRGVPVLHLQNTEELVSALDGRPATANPTSPDRVTVSRRLADSGDPVDRSASGSVTRAHAVETHVRTLEHARAVGSTQTEAVVRPIEELLSGERAETRYYRARRVGPAP